MQTKFGYVHIMPENLKKRGNLKRQRKYWLSTLTQINLKMAHFLFAEIKNGYKLFSVHTNRDILVKTTMPLPACSDVSVFKKFRFQNFFPFTPKRKGAVFFLFFHFGDCF